MVTLAGVAFGFASSTNVVKNAPVAPSARNHSVAGRLTPADSWPPVKSGWLPKYIARSAAPADDKVTMVPNAWFTSSGMSPAKTVWRDSPMSSASQFISAARRAAPLSVVK